jgi:Uma2 family endonuclease
MSDMKVRVERAEAYYYPDVFVTRAETDPNETLVKRSPTLVIEVLSESTAAFDRGAKLAHYRRLASLRQYVLIEPERRSVDVFRRNPEGHRVLYAFTGNEALQLASLDFH